MCPAFWVNELVFPVSWARRWRIIQNHTFPARCRRLILASNLVAPMLYLRAVRRRAPDLFLNLVLSIALRSLAERITKACLQKIFAIKRLNYAFSSSQMLPGTITCGVSRALLQITEIIIQRKFQMRGRLLICCQCVGTSKLRTIPVVQSRIVVTMMYQLYSLLLCSESYQRPQHFNNLVLAQQKITTYCLGYG